MWGKRRIWFHILALAGFVLFKHIISDKATKGGLYMFALVFLTSLLGILSDHMACNITALLILDIPAKAFNSVIFIYPVERMMMGVVAAFVMFMLMMRYTILSADVVAEEVAQTKMELLHEYLHNDVMKIINDYESK